MGSYCLNFFLCINLGSQLLSSHLKSSTEIRVFSFLKQDSSINSVPKIRRLMFDSSMQSQRVCLVVSIRGHRPAVRTRSPFCLVFVLFSCLLSFTDQSLDLDLQSVASIYAFILFFFSRKCALYMYRILLHGHIIGCSISCLTWSLITCFLVCTRLQGKFHIVLHDQVIQLVAAFQGKFRLPHLGLQSWKGCPAVSTYENSSVVSSVHSKLYGR